MSSRNGRLIIISAPSGCGKTTLCELLVKSVPNIARSVSLTTRKPRKTERRNSDYIFVSKKEFKKEIRNNNILEWALNFGYHYGTPKNKTLRLLRGGKDVILAIDVKGAMKVKRLYPDSVLIFIAPPSLKVLKTRLMNRNTDGMREVDNRIRVAKRELGFLTKYDYVVVNDKIDSAKKKLCTIVLAERYRVR